MIDDKDKCRNAKNKMFFIWLPKKMSLKNMTKVIIWLPLIIYIYIYIYIYKCIDTLYIYIYIYVFIDR